jgi:hypothetical protein
LDKKDREPRSITESLEGAVGTLAMRGVTRRHKRPDGSLKWWRKERSVLKERPQLLHW